MSGKSWGGQDATKGVQRYGNYFDASWKVGGGRGTQTWGTPYSSMSYGNVTLDPSIRALQEEALANNRSLYGQLGDFRSQIMGNNSAYMQARVNPLLQQQAQGRGELQRNLGMRGLGGSSFGQQSLTNYDIDTNRAISDQRALATNEGMNQYLQTFALQSALNGETFNASRDRLKMEMDALGLGTEQQRLMMQNFEAFQNRTMQNRNAIASSILKGFGLGGQSDSGSGSWGKSSGSSGGNK